METHETIYTTNPPFLSIKKADPPYFYAERKGRDSIAAFLINNEKLLIRYQPLPQFSDNELYPCPVTGSMDEREIPLKTALREVEEETGYSVYGLPFQDLGSFIIGTQTNEVVFCYAWDVSHLSDPRTPTGDGGIHEAMSENRWMTYNEAIKVATYSTLVIGLYKLRQLGVI